MKKLFYISVLSVLMFSCSEPDNLNENVSETSSNSALQAKAVNGESIIPLDSLKFPHKPPSSQRLTMDLWSTLYQLNGVNFFIQAKETYFGNNTFQSNGAGQPLHLAPYSATNSAQLFHLKFLPSSSGIPYLIYSSSSNAPIGAGSYPSSPNNYVLYTQNAGSTSLFGFSWDILETSSKNGYYLENQDMIGQGPNGPWDIYYYVLQAMSGQIQFAKQNSSLGQQFNFVPNDNFVVNSVTTTTSGAQILSSVPTLLKSGQVENNTTNNMTTTLTFNESRTNGSTFTETSGISTRKTGSVNAGIELFKIVKIGGSYTWENSTQETMAYGSSSSRTVSLTDSYNIIVPPSTMVEYRFEAMQHSINMPYIATMTGVNTSKVLNIEGFYSGVEYSTTKIVVTEYPLGSSLSNLARATPTRTYTLYSEK